MRIKRQRRKLRGKYSGNCLSCTAKWSKCWYIASAENQEEWEARLGMTVTPADDEVCFQCWDAKIRTSPKRKMNFKAEIPALDAILSDDIPYLRPAKRTNGNKRRALNEEYTQYSRLERYTVDSPSDPKPFYDDDDISDYSNDSSNELVDDDDLDSSNNDTQEDNELYPEGVMFEEESAVILLSTGFRTISPDHVCVTAYEADLSEDDTLSFDDMKSKKRGSYTCSKCGQLKKGHTCTVASPITDDLSSSISSPLSSSTELSIEAGLISLNPIVTHTQVSLHATLQSVAYQIQGVDAIHPSVLAQPVFS